MAHIDSRRERRRSKGLDMANISVKGRHGHAHAKHKRLRTRMHRHRTNQFVRSLGYIPCGLPYGCRCAPCPDRDLYLPDQVQRRLDTFKPCVRNHDVLGGIFAVGRHAVRHSTSFDMWFSWMKSYFPDTLAGRHALDHLMTELSTWTGCSCVETVRSSKQNVKSCTCGWKWPKAA